MAVELLKPSLYECAAVFREGLDLNGIALETHPRAVEELGKIVLTRMLPELSMMLGNRVLLSSLGAIQSYNAERESFENVEFTGNFSGIRICQIEKPEQLTDEEVIMTEMTDVVMVFRQRITDPNPVDLAWSDELFVPLTDIDHMRLVA